jgi:hypothetical protein
MGSSIQNGCSFESGIHFFSLASSSILFLLLPPQCQCAVCGPARTTLRTGCTVERTGIQHNDLTIEFLYNPFYKQRVQELESIDQVLVEKMGYVSE